MAIVVDETERRQALIRELIINASAAADASSVSTTRATVESILDVLVRELRLDFACARLNASSAAAPADLVRLPGGRGADDARVRAAFSRCLDAEVILRQ